MTTIHLTILSTSLDKTFTVTMPTKRVGKLPTISENVVTMSDIGLLLADI